MFPDNRFLSYLPLIASVLLCVLLWVCYVFQFDSFAAITAFPVWSWLIPGLLLSILGGMFVKKRHAAAVILLWTLSILFLADETTGIVRLYFPHPPKQETQASDRVIRVVSLNCAGGGLKSAAEVIPYKPDIVLFQESPRKESVAKIAKELYGVAGAFVWGVNNSIIANGKIVQISAAREFPYASQARVRLFSGKEIEVIYCRPPPMPIRFDIWSFDCWKAHLSDRRKKRSYMKAIARKLKTLPSDIPIIVGGDFNVPANDGATRELSPLLHDAYKEGGLGAGNTVMNDMPVHRFDQIWISGHFKSISLVTQMTKNSDHRMVIADLIIR